ncbi:MAG: aminotransferase class III-fold pyridoxal phosphate-dependent enzyme, partial [Candidatus Nanohaloarchaea archaeon]|nr:aminotransferase class III-fold pyridoxal phosphate-dependent enzyme [Candidatus Nanohaloarchaea archaeon]
VEIAIKAARRCTGSEVIVSNQDAYHGTAYGAMSAGRDSLGAPFEPLVAGFEQVPVPDGTESWYDRLAETFAEHDVAAYLTETILTHQGVTIPAAEHYDRVRE